jgi:hypothetical protein
MDGHLERTGRGESTYAVSQENLRGTRRRVTPYTTADFINIAAEA